MDIEKLKKLVEKNGLKLCIKGVHDISGGEGCSKPCASSCVTKCDGGSCTGVCKDAETYT